MFNEYFIQYLQVMPAMTTMIPFIILELNIFEIDSPFNVLLARMFMLFWMVFIDAFTYSQFNQCLDIFDWSQLFIESEYAILWRNGFQTLTICLMIGGCYLKDQYRSQVVTPPQFFPCSSSSPHV